MNLLHLYTGDGKGKTTAAMGLALRALGSGLHVIVAQFMKNGRSGELTALRQFPNVRVVEVTPISKFTFRMNDEEKRQTQIQQTEELHSLCEVIDTEKPQLMVFDELAVAAKLEMVSEEDMWRLIDAGLKHGEVVTTGRYAPASLIARADYVSEIVKRTHPFDKGIRARKGVEF